MRLASVIFGRIALVSRTRPPFLLATTIVIGIVFIILIIVLLFLIILLGQRIRFGDLAKVRVLRFFSSNDALFDQFLELGDKNILVKVSQKN